MLAQWKNVDYHVKPKIIIIKNKNKGRNTMRLWILIHAGGK